MGIIEINSATDGLILTLIGILLIFLVYLNIKRRGITLQMPTFGLFAAIAGVILLIIGLNVDAGSSTDIGNVVNLHRLHIKQVLYYFSGVCFIISSISFAVEKIVRNLKDIPFIP